LAEMKYRRLGTNGPEISVVGFGAWAVGGAWQFGWGEQDDAESVAAIRHALESGVNWVDTAAAYGHGHSEEVVGRALEPYAVGEDGTSLRSAGSVGTAPSLVRSRTTSAPRRSGSNARKPQASRGRAHRSLYQFHWPDDFTGTRVEDSWATMLELIEEGKVRWGGVSISTSNGWRGAAE
jgi:aryl-alcohol dehydrogenase-like predicted oxidoreductase